MELFKRLTASHLLAWLYPSRCLLCQQPGLDNKDICSDCYQRLPWNQQYCQWCAVPLAHASANDTPGICGKCQQKRPFFDQVYSVFRYEADIPGMIHQLKFNQRLSYARLLGGMLAEKVSALAADQNSEVITTKPDCLLPVPLHQKRLRKRGFNQSVELAKSLAVQQAIRLDTQTLVRCRETQAQSGLDARQRQKNIKAAFAVTKPVTVKHVAIVDDVVTTASTVNEVARILKQHGVQRVDVYCLARA